MSAAATETPDRPTVGPSSHEFAELVREHADMLATYLRAVVRDPSLADDLFQDTFLTAWRNLDRYDRQRPFGPWLRGIAAKLLLAQRRKSAGGLRLCEADVLEQLDARHRAAERPAGGLDEQLDALRGCLDKLPDEYRQAVELRYREGLKGARLAERLAIAGETMKKRLQRARARLLDCLRQKLPLPEVVP